jgi:hypothetical protein
MALRIYIMPLVLGGGPSGNGRKAKYTPPGYHLIPYGAENVCILAADVDAATHTTISADPQVSALPASLSNNLTAGAVSQAQPFLDGLNIPSQWVSTAITYVQLIRILGRIFQVANLFEASIGKLFVGGVTLSTQFIDLPQGVRTTLIQIATDHGWDTSGLSGASTVRQVLKFMADQFTDPIQLLGVVY